MMQLSLFQKSAYKNDVVYTPGYRVMVVKDPGLYAPADVTSSIKAAQVFRELLAKKGSPDREHFMLLMLNRANMILGFNVVTIGGQTSSQVHMPEIFRVLLLAGATSFVVCHNHPSGNEAPSPQDFDVTHAIFECSKLLELQFLDHIILSDFEKYYSFADAGKLG
jgi:DNA repair protein RadC